MEEELQCFEARSSYFMQNNEKNSGQIAKLLLRCICIDKILLKF